MINIQAAVRDRFDRESEDPRQSLIGNSFAIPVVCWLLTNWMYERGISDRIVPVEFGVNICILPLPWSSLDKFVPRQSVPSPHEFEIVRKYLRLAEAGSDIRLGINPPFRPRSWPRSALQSMCWNWRVSQSYKWTHLDHINVLELRALVQCLQWRMRRTGSNSVRFLHLCDEK